MWYRSWGQVTIRAAWEDLEAQRLPRSPTGGPYKQTNKALRCYHRIGEEVATALQLVLKRCEPTKQGKPRKRSLVDVYAALAADCHIDKEFLDKEFLRRCHRFAAEYSRGDVARIARARLSIGHVTVLLGAPAEERSELEESIAEHGWTIQELKRHVRGSARAKRCKDRRRLWLGDRSLKRLDAILDDLLAQLRRTPEGPAYRDDVPPKVKATREERRQRVRRKLKALRAELQSASKKV